MRVKTESITTAICLVAILWLFSVCIAQQDPTGAGIREAAVSGLFYPGDQRELERVVNSYLDAAEAAAVPNLRGLICPHAGYRYSGFTAAYGYKLLADRRDIDTVIVMAPSHYAAFQGASVTDEEAYRTPLGLIPVSEKTTTLAGNPPFVRNPACRVQRPQWWRQSNKKAAPISKDNPHTWEHSLEVQLPFLQVTLDSFELIPIVFGDADYQQAAGVLSNFIDEHTILIASSDLSHYHPYDDAVARDKTCVEAICDLDVDKMAGQEACGKLPILTMMQIAIEKGWQTRLLDYRNSGDTTGDKSGVVGYATIAFYEPQHAQTTEQPEPAQPHQQQAAAGELPADQQQYLIELARTTLTQILGKQDIVEPDHEAIPPALKEEKGCFVTLTINGQLRGCIGHIFPQEPLYLAVMHNAVSAAIRDWRFNPVKLEELDQIEIEISVLTVPHQLDYAGPADLLDRLRPRIDGVVFEYSGRKSTYLPQVWDQLPGKEQFLNHLAQKAGLPADTWRKDDVNIMTYQVQAFSESEF